MICHCLACDPKSGEIGLECTKEKKWTTDLLKRKEDSVISAFHSFIRLPHPSNMDYLTKCMKEYAYVWCQHKAS